MGWENSPNPLTRVSFLNKSGDEGGKQTSASTSNRATYLRYLNVKESLTSYLQG